MPHSLQSRSPPVFTIRLWQEPLDAEHVEWRGEVKNVASGEVRYFHDWQTLTRLLRCMLNAQEGGAGQDFDQEVDRPRIDSVD